MKNTAFLLAFLAPLHSHAALCTMVTDTGKQVFMFARNAPTRTVSGTVARLKPCVAQPPLIEYVDFDKDHCARIVYTYLNTETKAVETLHYYNGAVGADGVNWDRLPNAGCPALK